MSFRPVSKEQMMEAGETIILTTGAPDAPQGLAPAGAEFRFFHQSLVDTDAKVSRAELALDVARAEVAASRVKFDRDLRVLWAMALDPVTGKPDTELRAALLPDSRSMEELLGRRSSPLLASEGVKIGERGLSLGIDSDLCGAVAESSAELAMKVAGLETARRDVATARDAYAEAKQAWYAAWSRVVRIIRAVVPEDELDHYLVRWPNRRSATAPDDDAEADEAVAAGDGMEGGVIAASATG